MNHAPRLLALALSSSLLTLTASAQSGHAYARYTQPLGVASLDLGTGALTRGPAVQQQAQGTVAEFSNLDLSRFIATDTGSCFCRWIDAGIKGHNGNASDLMSNVVTAYCSSARDTIYGGPGGTTALGFYEGYTTGNATPSTTVAVFTLTGLPANTGSSSFFGNFQCHFLNLTLSNLICFADGPIGYSWKFLDGNGTGTYAQTWPILSCVQSCSGIRDRGGVGGPNLQDLYIDKYCPPGFLRSSFNFGTVPSYNGFPFVISIPIEIREVSDCPATITSHLGQGLNLDVQLAPSAVIGAPWSAQVAALDPTHPPNGLLLLLFHRNGLTTGPRISLLGGPVTELLLGPGGLAQPCPTGTYTGGVGTVCGGMLIPKELDLVGAPWCTQVLVGTTTTGFTFTNALCGTVGTF